MARLALAASVLLSLFLLSPAHRLLPTEPKAFPVIVGEVSDPATIRLPSDGKPSEESTTASASTPEANTVDELLPTVAESQAVPIEVSFIPVPRDFTHRHPRVVGRPLWHRLGRHCHHLHHGPRGAVIPYGDDMMVSEEQIRRGYEGGRYFVERSHPVMTEEIIPVEELGKQREMGFPHEMRPFPRFRPHREGEEGERGLVKRFLDLLNPRH